MFQLFLKWHKVICVLACSVLLLTSGSALAQVSAGGTIKTRALISKLWQEVKAALSDSSGSQLAQVAGSGATFYVATNGNDANSGTQSAPFKTIQRCANVAQAGDTCLVSAGTYNERVSTVQSGTASNRIYIGGASSTKPSVNGFTLSHAYITVEGFIIANTGTAVSVGGGANYCEINNNEFRGAQNGISMSSSSASPVGCRIQGNWFHGSTSVSVMIGLGGSGHVVEGNEFGPLVMYEDAFRPFGDNHIIRNNSFHNITSGGGGGHRDIFQIFNTGGRVRNLLFEQNYIDGWPGQAWMVDCTPDSELITVRNNVFFNVDSAGQSYCPKNLIYNNVFAYSGQNGRAIMIRSEAGRGLGTDSRIKNNIFYYTGYGDTYSGGYDVDAGAQATFEGGNNIAYPFTSSGLDLDTNSLNGVDPQFVSESDFHLRSGSPAIDKGTALAGFNNDIFGTTRPQGSAWDIGAHEYVSTVADSIAPRASTGLRVW